MNHEWSEVGIERLVGTPGQRYVRGRRFNLWRVGDHLGVFVTGPQAIPDIEQAWTLSSSLPDGPDGRRWLIDARGFRLDGPFEPALMFMMTESRARLSAMLQAARQTVVVPPADWLSPWFRGMAGESMPMTTFARDIDDACSQLEMPAEVRAAVMRLTEATRLDTRLLEQLEAVIRADPAADLAALAGRLGRTGRTLQRELADANETFVEVRSRVRSELAMRLLMASPDKLEVIAAHVGFRSVSHFGVWFRGLTGETPTAFRARLRGPARDGVPAPEQSAEDVADDAKSAH